MTEQLSDHTTDAYALQVQGLTKRYGDLVAVDDLSLQIKKEEIFGFLGPNGAGKTTAINMMVGLLSPTGGAVLINGQDRARVPKRSVGVCPQELVLWEELTCVENLTLIGDMYDLPRWSRMNACAHCSLISRFLKRRRRACRSYLEA